MVTSTCCLPGGSRIGAIWGLALSDDGEMIYYSEPHRAGFFLVCRGKSEGR